MTIIIIMITYKETTHDLFIIDQKHQYIHVLELAAFLHNLSILKILVHNFRQ